MGHGSRKSPVTGARGASPLSLTTAFQLILPGPESFAAVQDLDPSPGTASLIHVFMQDQAKSPTCRATNTVPGPRDISASASNPLFGGCQAKQQRPQLPPALQHFGKGTISLGENAHLQGQGGCAGRRQSNSTLFVKAGQWDICSGTPTARQISAPFGADQRPGRVAWGDPRTHGSQGDPLPPPQTQLRSQFPLSIILPKPTCGGVWGSHS